MKFDSCHIMCLNKTRCKLSSSVNKWSDHDSTEISTFLRGLARGRVEVVKQTTNTSLSELNWRSRRRGSVWPVVSQILLNPIFNHRHIAMRFANNGWELGEQEVVRGRRSNNQGVQRRGSKTLPDVRNILQFYELKDMMVLVVRAAIRDYNHIIK